MADQRSALEAGDVRTFLIADIRGYTRFTQEQGDVRGSELAARFAVLVRNVMPDWHGHLLELRGDEALCVFASSRQALGAAVELQTRFRQPADDGSRFPLGIGIGLDAGEALPVEGGYRGGALNLAARLCAQAGAGEILASEQVVHLARRIEGMRFEAPRVLRLKGIDEQVRVVRVVPSQELPPAGTAAPSRPRRWPIAVLAAVLLVAAAAAAVLLQRSSSASGLPAPDVVSTTNLGVQRTVLASGGAGTFVVRQTGADSGQVERIGDAGGPSPWADLAGIPYGLAVGSNGVWALTVSSNDATAARLVRVQQGTADPGLALPGRPSCVDYRVVACNPVTGGGSVWVPVGSTLYQVSTDGRRRQAQIDTGGRIFDVGYAAGSVWVLSGTRLLKVDPGDTTVKTLDLGQSIGAGLQPNHLTSSGSDLWIGCFGPDASANVLLHVQAWRPSLGVARVLHYPSAGAISADGAALWVSSADGWHRLQRLDARSGDVTGAPAQLDDTVTWIAPSQQDVWVTTFHAGDGMRRLVHLTV